MKTYHRRTNCQAERAQHIVSKGIPTPLQTKRKPDYIPPIIHQYQKIQELTEVIERCRDLPDGSYSSVMFGMIKSGHLTTETLLAFLYEHVRVLREGLNG